MTSVYILCALLLLVVVYGVYRQSMAAWVRWAGTPSTRSRAISGVALLFCLCAVSAWLFVVYWTVSSWIISLDPSVPKPHFLVFYVLGLFAVAICMAVAKVLHGLAALGSDSSAPRAGRVACHARQG